MNGNSDDDLDDIDIIEHNDTERQIQRRKFSISFLIFFEALFGVTVEDSRVSF